MTRFRQPLETVVQLVRAIRLCADQKLVEPTLILIYTTIDIHGWLDRETDSDRNRATFTRWTERYFLPAEGVSCTATELYAARCGMLHRCTPD